jgi:hypothetical protein
MADYGLHKNSEGYADPTAYEAIRGMAKPGEIWTYKERKCLIIKNQGSYSNLLQLGSYKKGSVCVAGKLYAQPGMLSYAFNDLLTERVETLSGEEFNEILKEVADALELRFAHEVETGELVAAVNERTKEKFKQWAAKAEHVVLPVEVDPEKEALKAKVEMLQSMYNDLLAKVIEKVGA